MLVGLALGTGTRNDLAVEERVGRRRQRADSEGRGSGDQDQQRNLAQRFSFHRPPPSDARRVGGQRQIRECGHWAGHLAIVRNGGDEGKWSWRKATLALLGRSSAFTLSRFYGSLDLSAADSSKGNLR